MYLDHGFIFSIEFPDPQICYYNVSNCLKTAVLHYICNLFRINPIKMIKVSETAKARVTTLMTEEGYDVTKDYVRVGVKSGGCSGLSYELKFDNAMSDTDKVFEDNEVRILVDKKSFLYLVGTTLEYSGGLNGKGFVFNNPNAQRTCGCGESFSL
jgi:iron-sulfur cluster assembly protein